MKLTSRLLCGAALFAALLSAAMADEAKVVSAATTLSFTFIEVTDAAAGEGKTKWLASEVVGQVKPGDRISFNVGYMMMDFYSNDLLRGFPTMSFVNEVKVIPEK
ncbi:hypothetical protein [Rhodoferax sp.]|uniref:hypothetical protein n=1 Tax=Rhodoferax sp. TaxID=50421 RepID=UPI002638DD9B|nr:hypothetical protein [Rhodoferax sp.]MDD2918859.1 hypothetical protein [Rhodoferax sp.]